MNKHRCKKCGYIYDSAQHDGATFESLPGHWPCPLCGVGKDEFEVVHHLGEEYTGGEAQEKHVPVITQEGTTVTVKVGSVDHPMIPTHYITRVELHSGGKLLKGINLQPDTEPIAVFENIEAPGELKALAYCNLHGVWES